VVHVLLNHLPTHSLGAATFVPFHCSDLSFLLTNVNEKLLTPVNWNPTLVIYSNLLNAVGTNFG